MTRDEIKNTPELVDFMLDESIIADSRMKLHKRLEELCKLAIKALEQEPFINKPCVSSGVCEHDKNKILDKIRAEVLEEMLSHSGTGEEVIQAYADGLKKGLEFIDKYKGESEET